MILSDRRNSNALREQISSQKYYWALFIFCICGLVGVFVDIDHLEPYIRDKTPISPSTFGNRPYHLPILIFTVFVLLYSYSLIYRLTLVVLRDKYEKEQL